MENPKPSETLDGASVVSKLDEAQTPFDKTLEEASGLSGLGGRSSELVLESAVLVGKNGGSFDANPKEFEVNNVEISNRVFDVKKEMKCVQGDSSSNIEVSGNISLFVEMFGPLNGVIQTEEADLKEDLLGGECSGGGGVCEVNEAMTNEEAGGGEESVANQECKFLIGDFVWVKTKTQSWWPGLIYDPFNSLKDLSETDHKDFLLVRYFGNGSLVWVSPSQLRPFVENFERFSRQSNSKNFLIAVEKALDEIGQRVNTEMTCPCMLKGNWNLHEAEEQLGVCGANGNSSNEFEPTDFVAFLKYLAIEGSMPSMLEFTVARNNLSAFYRALGHKQLPMHQLRGTTDARESDADELTGKSSFDGQIRVNSRNELVGDGFSVDMGLENDEGLSTRSGEKSDSGKADSEVGKGSDEAANLDVCKLASLSTRDGEVFSKGNSDQGEGKSEKGFDSRGRKKSKYLSPPYINLSTGRIDSLTPEENKTDGCKEVSLAGQSLGSPSVVKCSTKKSKKKLSKKAVSGHNNKTFAKLKRINASSAELLSELRLASLDCLYPNENEDFDSIGGFVSGFRRWVFGDESYNEAYNKRKDGKKSDHKSNLLQTGSGGEVPVEKGKDMEEGKNDSAKPRKRKKKEERTVSSNDKSTNILQTSAGGEVPMEKGKEMEEGNNVPAKPRKRKKKDESTVSSDDKSIPVLLDMNEKVPTSGSMVIDFQEMRILAPEGKPVPKKRKKKAVPTQELPPTNSAFPDLNVNGTTPSTVVEDSETVGPSAPQEKPEPKKRKRSRKKSVASLGDSSANTAKLDSFFQNVEVVCGYSFDGIPELYNREEIKGSAPFSLNIDFTAGQTDLNGKNGVNSSLTNDWGPIGSFSSGGKLEPKRRKRKEKPSTSVPDLNGNIAEPNSLGKDSMEKNCVSVEGKTKIPRKRRKNKPFDGVQGIFVNYNKVDGNGESLGTGLLLKFAPGFQVPPKEVLASTFCGFGPLVESEMRVLDDSGSAQIVFSKSSDARNAFLSLEKGSPFGAALVHYSLMAGSGAPQDKPELKKRKIKDGDITGRSRKKRVVSVGDSNATTSKFDSFFKNVQIIGGCSVDSTPELNYVEGSKGVSPLCLNNEFTACQTDLIGKNGENSSPPKDSVPIPDLNGNASEPNSLGKDFPEMNSVSVEGKTPHKRSKNKDVYVNYNKMETNGESFGTALLLKFAPGFEVPLKEALVPIFCAFGQLKESETQVLNDSGSAQIVFSNSSDARNAFLSLGKNSPFGAALVNYRLVPLLDNSGSVQLDSNLYVPLPSKPVERLKKNPLKPSGSKPNYRKEAERVKNLLKPSGLTPDHQKEVERLKNPSKPPGFKPDHPDLLKVRQNLEMMTTMMETAGDNLSPEMREKLESEIKGLLKKVSTMVGSTSSS